MRKRAILVLLLVFPCWVCAAPAFEPAVLSTSDVSLMFQGGDHAPKLATLSGIPEFRVNNEAMEPLPASVEINGASVPLNWEINREASTHDKNHVLFVYESANPHLRLDWEWEARAGFGPVEHRITVKNLGNHELWLPLIDSLRLQWVINKEFLQHFYVEKGADSPSAHGTHLKNLSDGYH